MALATLSIDIEARLANFEKAMDRSARIAEKNAQEVRASWQRAGAGIAAIGTGVAGLFAGYSLVDAFKGNVDFIDSLNDMQDATGASIEKLSGLVDLAERTGHSVDTATTLVVKLNQALGDTDPNSTASRAIAAIGLSADELRKMDPVDAIQAVSRALANYADDGSKARLVQELFGKSARERAPLIKDLADAGQLNARITSEQAAEADKFNKELARLQTNTAALGRSITADLLPPLNKLLELKREKGLGGAIMDLLGFDDKFDRTKQMAAAGETLRALAFEKKVLEEQLRADYTNADTPRRRDRLTQIVQVELPREIAAYKAAIAKLQGVDRNEDYSNEGRNAPKPTVGELPDKTKKEKTKKEEIEDAQRALAQYVETQQRELDQLSDLTEVQKAYNFLRTLGTTGEIDQVRQLVLDQAKAVTVRKQDIALGKAAADGVKEQETNLKALNDQLDQFSGRLDEARKQALTARLEARLNAGEEFSKDELDNIVRGIGGIEKPKQDLDQLTVFAQEAGRNIQDTLGQSMYATLSGQWGSLGDLWAQTVMKMIAEASAAQLGSLLLGDFAKTGSVGGWAGQALSFLSGFFADGGAFGVNGQIRAFAAGDVFSSPTLFGYGRSQMGVLGEAGPEAIMPLKRGADGKLGVVSRGGGGGRVLQVTYAPQIAIDSRSDRAAILSDVRREVSNGNKQLVKMLKGQGAIA